MPEITIELKNHGKGNRYYDIMCNGQCLERVYHGGKRRANEVAEHYRNIMH